MHIGTDDEFQRDAGIVEVAAQRGDGRRDSVGGVLVHARIDVRRARDGADAVIPCDARHRERSGRVGRAVVDRGKQVAVEVEHRGGRYVSATHGAPENVSLDGARAGLEPARHGRGILSPCVYRFRHPGTP